MAMEEERCRLPCLQGTGAVTLFAPTEAAFDKLPPGLRRFLFSPFGERALKKIISFHIVPDLLLHSDWIYNTTDSIAATKVADPTVYEKLTEIASLDYGWSLMGFKCGEGRRRYRKHHGDSDKAPEFHPRLGKAAAPRHPEPEHKHHFPGPKPIVTFNSSVSTLLEGSFLNITVLKPATGIPFELPFDEIVAEGGGPHPAPPPGHPRHPLPALFRSLVFVNHLQTFAEVPARNGVVYVINSLLHPFKHSEHDHELSENVWDDWEEWLPAWAAL